MNSQQLDTILEWLKAQIAEAIGGNAREIDANVRFREFGLESAMLTGMLARLSEAFGCLVSPTAPWEHPTPLALAKHEATPGT